MVELDLGLTEQVLIPQLFHLITCRELFALRRRYPVLGPHTLWAFTLVQ